MPRAPSFKTTSIADLERQLRYAPPEARRRQMLAAERLIDEIEEGRAYPEEFIIYRITRYRRASDEESPLLVGAALLSDLATLVQCLSATLHLPFRTKERGEAAPIDDLAQQLGIAARTLRRYHKRGLLFHYVCDEGQRPQLACYASSLDKFSRRHTDLITRAREYSRIDDDAERSIVAEAIRLHSEQGLTRQEAARTLAAKHGRAVETMRLILARGERAAGARVFRGMRRFTAREEEFVARAWERWIPISQIARRLGKSALTIRRAVNGWRLVRLRSLRLQWIELPTFALPEAETIILSSRDATEDLCPPAHRDGIELIDRLPGTDRGGDEMEEARLAAYNLLKKRVAQRVAALEPFPNDADLDFVERDLRWATLLKRTLVESAMAAGVLRIEQTLSRPLRQQTADVIRALLRVAVEEISAAIDVADPSRNQRIERIAALSIDKAIARSGMGRSPSAAGARHAPGSVPLGDPFARLCAWQEWTELAERFHPRLAGLDEEDRALIDAFYGLDEQRPRSPREIATERELSLRAVQKALSQAHRALRGQCTDRVG